MSTNDVDILLVEDNPQDAELTTRALKKHNLANRLFVVEDGARGCPVNCYFSFLARSPACSGSRVTCRLSPVRLRLPS